MLCIVEQYYSLHFERKEPKIFAIFLLCVITNIYCVLYILFCLLSNKLIFNVAVLDGNFLFKYLKACLLLSDGSYVWKYLTSNTMVYFCYSVASENIIIHLEFTYEQIPTYSLLFVISKSTFCEQNFVSDVNAEGYI